MHAVCRTKPVLSLCHFWGDTCLSLYLSLQVGGSGKLGETLSTFHLGGSIQFSVLSKTYSLMGHYNHSISVDTKIMVSKYCPIIGEQVAVNLMAQ